MRAAITAAVRIEGDDLAHRFFRTSLERCQLFRGKSVTYNDESIPVEDPNGPLDFTGVKNFEPFDAVVGAEVGPEVFDSPWCHSNERYPVLADESGGSQEEPETNAESGRWSLRV